RLRDIRVLDQRHVVMGHLAAVRAAVETHLRHRPRPHVGARPQRPHLLQTDDLGPESMRLLDVAHVEDNVIHTDGSRRRTVAHRSSLLGMANAGCPPSLPWASTASAAQGQGLGPSLEPGRYERQWLAVDVRGEWKRELEPDCFGSIDRDSWA